MLYAVKVATNKRHIQGVQKVPKGYESLISFLFIRHFLFPFMYFIKEASEINSVKISN